LRRICAGVFIGSLIEERLALGYINIQVVVIRCSAICPIYCAIKDTGNFLDRRREGWEKTHYERPREKVQRMYLMEYLEEASPNAFIISYEPKHLKGGFWVKSMRNA
jgi:uncharacterized protein YebE (UPF0316 family)